MNADERARRIVYNVMNTLGLDQSRAGPTFDSAVENVLHHVKSARREAMEEVEQIVVGHMELHRDNNGCATEVLKVVANRIRSRIAEEAKE